MIKGQDKLIQKIYNLNLDTFPRTLMLLGEEGSGKHSIVSIISDHLNLPIDDITESISLEKLNEIELRIEPHIYILSVNSISLKEENTILKFLEEPLKNSFIILLANGKDGLLPTILNRCQVWPLEKYKKVLLKELFPEASDDILDICNTPGQIEKALHCNFSHVYELSEKIIDKINIASVSNTLSLSEKVAFKQEKDKIDCSLLIKVIHKSLRNRWVENSDLRYASAHTLTKDLIYNFKQVNLDRKMLFEQYLLDLKTIMRG